MRVFIYYPFTVPKNEYVEWEAVFFILSKKIILSYFISHNNTTIQDIQQSKL
jgi:hypothetical protein